MDSIKARIERLEKQSAPKVDIAAILIQGRERHRASLAPSPAEPIVGNSLLAKAIRAARKRVGR